MNKHTTPTIAEFELLCMLKSIPEDGCEVRDFIARLGLSPTLECAVRRACASIAGAGLISFTDDRLALTPDGVIRRAQNWIR